MNLPELRQRRGANRIRPTADGAGLAGPANRTPGVLSGTTQLRAKSQRVCEASRRPPQNRDPKTKGGLEQVLPPKQGQAAACRVRETRPGSGPAHGLRWLHCPCAPLSHVCAMKAENSHLPWKHVTRDGQGELVAAVADITSRLH